jgi:hypothetical protein
LRPPVTNSGRGLFIDEMHLLRTHPTRVCGLE